MQARSYQTVLQETTAIIARFCKAEVTEHTHLLRDLDLDSLGVAELVAEIEDHFDVMIPMKILPELRSVADTARCLTALLDAEADGPRP